MSSVGLCVYVLTCFIELFVLLDILSGFIDAYFDFFCVF